MFLIKFKFLLVVFVLHKEHINFYGFALYLLNFLSPLYFWIKQDSTFDSSLYLWHKLLFQIINLIVFSQFAPYHKILNLFFMVKNKLFFTHEQLLFISFSHIYKTLIKNILETKYWESHQTLFYKLLLKNNLFFRYTSF